MANGGTFITVKGKIDNDKIRTNFGTVFKIKPCGIVNMTGYFLLFKPLGSHIWQRVNAIYLSDNGN